MHACSEAGLAAAEESRRLAMLAADAPRLAAMLSESLVYVHSTGVRDGRDQYLERLVSGALRYETLEFTAPHYRLLGSVGLVHAGMRATVLRNDGRHAVASSTLAVWQHADAGWQLQALHASPAAP